MSQMVVPIDKHTECLLGWDNPLQTFFGQVYRIDEEGERVDLYEEDCVEKDGTILWVGASVGEIATVEDLAARLRPFVELPRDVKDRLSAEND